MAGLRAAAEGAAGELSVIQGGLGCEILIVRPVHTNRGRVQLHDSRMQLGMRCCAVCVMICAPVT